MNLERALETMAEGIFLIYLGWCSLQDFKEMQVIRYTHILAGVSLFVLAASKQSICKEELFIYGCAIGFLALLQGAAYAWKLYGVADMFVFTGCGIYFMLSEGVSEGMLAYAILQAVSGAVLFVVQLMKKNIKGLYLARPVAYIPYISVAFILTKVVI